jgi:hypothetical protein
MVTSKLGWSCDIFFIILLNLSPRYEPEVVYVFSPDLSAAWLSIEMDRGKDRFGSVEISFAARVRPTVSASYTVCSLSVPRWYFKTLGCAPARNKMAAAPIFPFAPEPSLYT